jgi:hypothetical protein
MTERLQRVARPVLAFATVFIFLALKQKQELRNFLSGKFLLRNFDRSNKTGLRVRRKFDDCTAGFAFSPRSSSAFRM